MNNHYNQIALSEIGRWMDNLIYWGETHLYISIPILLLIGYFLYKFWRRPIQ